MKCLWITEHVVPKRRPRDRGTAQRPRAQRLSLVNINFNFILKYHITIIIRCAVYQIFRLAVRLHVGGGACDMIRLLQIYFNLSDSCEINNWGPH